LPERHPSADRSPAMKARERGWTEFGRRKGSLWWRWASLISAGLGGRQRLEGPAVNEGGSIGGRGGLVWRRRVLFIAVVGEEEAVEPEE
jgi:hypothetical protein